MSSGVLMQPTRDDTTYLPGMINLTAKDLYVVEKYLIFTTTCMSILNALRRDEPQKSERGRLLKFGQ